LNVPDPATRLLSKLLQRGASREIVAHHVEADPCGTDFAAFAARHPALLDKRLLSRHYASATLASPAARAGWVPPDLAAFPWV
jgi:hypothetical protein